MGGQRLEKTSAKVKVTQGKKERKQARKKASKSFVCPHSAPGLDRVSKLQDASD